MSVTQVQYQSALTVLETLSVDAPDIATQTFTVKHSGFNSGPATYTPDTTPPVSLSSSFEKALVGGAGTIDLTSLPDTLNSPQSGAGKRVQFVKFQNPANNTGDMVLTAGASNGYDLFGSGWQITLRPGQEFLWSGYSAAPVIGTSAKNIGITGSGTEELNVLLVIG